MKFINKETIIAALVGGLTVIALTMGGVALAYSGAHGGHRLSAEQEAGIRAIVQKAQAQRQEIKEMPRGKEKFVAMRDLRFATEDQIYANLNCEQREELRLLKREHKVERMEERHERRHLGDTK
jgi:hypothetical protein